MAKLSSAEPRFGRIRVIRREERRYACGCSTTRIEAFSVPEVPADVCQAHQGTLVSEAVVTEYEKPEDLTVP